MIPDLDIWRSAHLLVKHHGEDAPIDLDALSSVLVVGLRLRC